MNRFDIKTHTYYIAEVAIPSINQLLPKQDFHVSEERLEETRQEGEDNHSMIKMFYDTNQETFNDPMLIALKSWLEENKNRLGELRLYERPLFSEKLRFAGTEDCFFSNAIIEFKRLFGNSKIHSLQIAAQEILGVENKIISKTNKWLVLVFDGKNFKMKNVYNKQATEIFIALVKKYWIDQAVNNYLKI